MSNGEKESNSTVVELIAPNGLGFGEGGISVKSQIEQGILTPDTPQHIHDLLTNDSEAFKQIADEVVEIAKREDSAVDADHSWRLAYADFMIRTLAVAATLTAGDLPVYRRHRAA